MLQLTPQTPVYVAVEHQDFRKGIDGLAQVCRQHLDHDPFSGAIFVFRNRRGTAIKCLCFDGQGFWLCLKRFSKDKLAWWPKGRTPHTLTHRDLQILLWNGNPEVVELSADWRRVSY